MVKQSAKTAKALRLSAGLICAAVISFMTAPSSFAASGSSKSIVEYNIKAAYIYNFIRFTKWSESSASGKNSPVVVAIVGDSPFDRHAFDSVNGKLIPGKNRKLVVREIGAFNSAADLKHCNVVFVCASEKKNFRKIIKSIGRSSVMTIADSPGFVEAGGMINLVVRKQKIRWEINVDAIRLSSLKVNSQIYKSAVRVVNSEE